jgi:hypothetical protein
MLFASLAVLVAGATAVHAHGYAQVVTVGGKEYQAFHPFVDPYATPVPQTVERKVADDGPSECTFVWGIKCVCVLIGVVVQLISMMPR